MKTPIYLSIYLTLLTAALASAADLPSYSFNELLGHNWQNEHVSYPLKPNQLRQLKGNALVDSNGKETLFQLDAAGQKLHFIANIRPFTKQTYSFQYRKPQLKSDINVSRRGGVIELRNSKFAVRINTKLKGNAAPLHSWQLPSGTWMGGTSLESNAKVMKYEAVTIAAGPVFAEVQCTTEFEGGGKWTVAFVLQAHEPLIKITETFDCIAAAASYHIQFDKGLQPDLILYRTGGMFTHKGLRTSLGKLVVDDFAEKTAGVLFQLEPWLHWQHAKNRGTGFSLFNADDDNTCFMVTAAPADWVDPHITNSERAPGLNMLRKSKDGAISISFHLKKGKRRYLIGGLSKTEVLRDLYGAGYDEVFVKDDMDGLLDGGDAAIPDGMADERKKLQDAVDRDPLDKLPKDRQYRAALHQQYRIKHSDFPLDWIKDFVLEWERQDRQHPRMLVTQKQVETFRKTFKYEEKDLVASRRQIVNAFSLDRLIPMYLGTGDKVLEERFVNAAVNMVQGHATGQLNGNIVSVGVAPHNFQKRFPTTLNLVDCILDSDLLTDKKRQRMLAQIAFVGYMLNNPAYWDSSRGFGAMFINMHTTVAATKTAIAGFLPDHPKCNEWMGIGLGYMKEALLDKWADKDGRWLGTHVEAPHYAMCSYDDILGVLLMAHNVGLGDDIYGDTVKNMGAWFAKISTPRDIRFLDRRHLPPIANTYKFEPSGIFGVLAGIYRKKDPKFSAEMQWMQMQQGDHTQPGVGGFAAALSGYRRVIGNHSLPSKPPSYKSEWFNQAGVVLRSLYNTPSENMLYMIAGTGAVPQRHYDWDQGAITIWGKGQIISDDFGYNGCAPEEEQSMISSSAARGIMKITDFVTDPAMDYVSGKKGAWTRQIVLVKGDVETPSYYVIHDSFDKPSQATWRMWLSAKPVERHGATILDVGRKKEEGDELDDLLDMGDGDDLLGDANPPADESEMSIYLGDKDVLVNGFGGVQTDIFFAALPPRSKLKHATKTKSPAGMNSKGRYLGAVPTTQIGIVFESRTFKSLLTLVFPRSKNTATPKVTPIASGRGFEIIHKDGKDNVFLSERPTTFKKGDLTFEGTVGLTRTIKGKTSLTLAAPGSVKLGAKQISRSSTKNVAGHASSTPL